MDDAPRLGAGELAARIRSELGLGSWLYLLVPAGEVDSEVATKVRAALATGGTESALVKLDGSINPMMKASGEAVLVALGFKHYRMRAGST